MGDDTKPGNHLRLASEQSDQELAQKREAEAVARTLRRLAANIIRITRGAGKPYDLTDDCISFIKAIEGYVDRTQQSPPFYDFQAMLSIKRAFSFELNNEEFEMECARDQMVRGSLQITASRLLKQNTQESAGSSELMGGVREWRRIIDERNHSRMKGQRKAKQKGKPKEWPKL